jgi:hypothetical protein
MRATDLLLEFYEPSSDSLSKREMSDTRRPKLTIRHLHKIRKMRDIEMMDRKAHLLRIKQVYNTPSDGGEGEMGGF